MLNKINFYQFDNLINNRVPFVFFNLAVDLSDWYTSVSKSHLITHQIQLKNTGEALSILETKKTPKDYAIVLLCSDGVESTTLFEILQNSAYTNVYVIDGGYQQLMTERSQSC